MFLFKDTFDYWKYRDTGESVTQRTTYIFDRAVNEISSGWYTI